MKKKIKFTSDYICHDCGIKYGKPKAGAITIHQGKCGVCGKTTGICHQRNYGYPLENNNFIYEE